MSSFMGGSSSLGGLRSNTGGGLSGTSTGFTPTSKGTLKRGGIEGEYIPKGYRAGQLQQFTPQQMELFNQLFGYLGPESFLSKLAGGDESAFEQMEAPAHRMFQGQLGQLASRFSGMGTGGRLGSGFQNTATAAQSNFAENLAANRQNLQRQALMDLMGLSHQLLGERPYTRGITEKQQSPGFLESLIGSAPKETFGALGSGLKGAIGGGMHGGLPGALWGGLGGLFKDF